MQSKHPRFAGIKGINTHRLPDDEPSSVSADLRAAIRAEVEAYLSEQAADKAPDFSDIPGHVMHVAPRKRGEKS